MIFRGEIRSFFSGKLLKTLVFLSFLLVSCTGKRAETIEYPKMTHNTIVAYAKRFEINILKGYSQLSVIDPWQGASNIVQKWYPIPRGAKIPSSIDSSQVIKVPVRNIICMSTTHLAMIAALDETSSITGFSGTRFLFSNDLLKKVGNGTIREIGYEDNLNKELILKLHPDLIMVYGIGSESAGFIGKLKELGMKILYNADYLEIDPLGKAEWIKLIGALYSKEHMADSIFSTIETEYNQTKSYVNANTWYKPKVLLGLPFKDTWYVSPGNSYVSRLIEDAGGDYLWHGTESSVSMPIGLENVYIKALSANYWLNTGTADSKDEILSVDSRFAELPSFKNGNLYNNNNRININGGNDYWESGSLNPHVILKDIAYILHPQLFPERELYYYKKVK
jgi:iron complex transport system substrate-binding protein